MTEPMRKRDLPFPRHWLAYIVIKLALIAVAVILALKYYGAW